jgi:hypothetical protein
MIQSDTQRERTVIKLAGFRRALERVPAEPMNKRNSTLRASYEQIIRQLEDELREYDRPRSAM